MKHLKSQKTTFASSVPFEFKKESEIANLSSTFHRDLKLPETQSESQHDEARSLTMQDKNQVISLVEAACETQNTSHFGSTDIPKEDETKNAPKKIFDVNETRKRYLEQIQNDQKVDPPYAPTYPITAQEMITEQISIINSTINKISLNSSEHLEQLEEEDAQKEEKGDVTDASVEVLSSHSPIDPLLLENFSTWRTAGTKHVEFSYDVELDINGEKQTDIKNAKLGKLIREWLMEDAEFAKYSGSYSPQTMKKRKARLKNKQYQEAKLFYNTFGEWPRKYWETDEDEGKECDDKNLEEIDTKKTEDSIETKYNQMTIEELQMMKSDAAEGAMTADERDLLERAIQKKQKKNFKKEQFEAMTNLDRYFYNLKITKEKKKSAEKRNEAKCCDSQKLFQSDVTLDKLLTETIMPLIEQCPATENSSISLKGNSESTFVDSSSRSDFCSETPVNSRTIYPKENSQNTLFQQTGCYSTEISQHLLSSRSPLLLSPPLHFLINSVFPTMESKRLPIIADNSGFSSNQKNKLINLEANRSNLKNDSRSLNEKYHVNSLPPLLQLKRITATKPIVLSKKDIPFNQLNSFTISEDDILPYLTLKLSYQNEPKQYGTLSESFGQPFITPLSEALFCRSKRSLKASSVCTAKILHEKYVRVITRVKERAFKQTPTYHKYYWSFDEIPLSRKRRKQLYKEQKLEMLLKGLK
ncbi:uncharacterized protein MONOS_6406 [Monocercomonoides exilis]|uniref:uncharacterized protein n=1 Tax=Monocercomonoides exilis TaxID=2049356 RepID=UPI00355A1C47|nr:hypothetical protein MONOS_6406 [Monocercomonoides exilis]|eukprot:MONOS_6406.1-p1 / transcript=MONOS_6406.1 / gene=MONOS_6406 / organism=Monocercomonoides_exilis_PA203 / gene_product=unspecified product / transcript_product=unspecified product / location=Mono_scaffold00201:73102-75258(-) / protein_length=700 / sequence_SO=supercontig / SO=protein_coding / is_pseudo=false